MVSPAGGPTGANYSNWDWAAISPENQARIMTGALGTAEEQRRAAEQPSEIDLRRAQAAHIWGQAKKEGLQVPQPFTLSTGQTVMALPSEIMNYSIHSISNQIQQSHVNIMRQAQDLKEQAYYDEQFGRTPDAKLKYEQADKLERQGTALQNFRPTGRILEDIPQLMAIHPESANAYIKGLLDQDSMRKARHVAEAWQRFYEDALQTLNQTTAWLNKSEDAKFAKATEVANQKIHENYNDDGSPKTLGIGGTSTTPSPKSGTPGASSLYPPPDAKRTIVNGRIIYTAPSGEVWEYRGGSYIKQ